MATATPGPDVAASWERIESWLAANAPEQRADLAGGAKAAAIAKAEKRLGVALPAAFVASCTIHDGQLDELDLIPDGFGTYYLIPVRDIPDERELMDEMVSCGDLPDERAAPDPGVAGDWWNSGWIPFATNGANDYLCLDLAPAKRGKLGQVIKVQHDDPARTLVAPSFEAWLAALADALEAGELDDFL